MVDHVWHCCDPDAPGGIPVLQQPGLKDRPQRRRPGSDGIGQPRDECGGRRERDRDRVGRRERYDRIENSSSHDYPSGGPEGGRILILRSMMLMVPLGCVVHPFNFDMPPPPRVLMSVPRAGPLGPFVPAAPEVAMRMLRDQGRPGPYEGNGSPQGRKGCSGPAVVFPGPIISVPPAFKQDSRCITRYQDLDAPEDEVTVIDYRSL